MINTIHRIKEFLKKSSAASTPLNETEIKIYVVLQILKALGWVYSRLFFRFLWLNFQLKLGGEIAAINGNISYKIHILMISCCINILYFIFHEIFKKIFRFLVEFV